MALQKFIRNKSINRINFFGMLSGALFIIVFAALVIVQEYLRYQNDISELEKNFHKTQRDLIVQETNRALHYIQYKHLTHNENEKSLQELQKELIDAIEHMRDERDGTGYIFIYTFDGINIADPILKQNAGKNLINFTDIHGKKVIKELIDISQYPNGGFVEYVWNKPITNKPAPKISFAKAYMPWKWMVGSGVYLDTVEEVILKRKSEHAERMLNFSISVVIGAIILFMVVTALSNKIASLIRMETQAFINFFNRAATRHESIDSSQLHFSEFQTISQYANTMLDEIHQTTNELQELNKNLEARVEKKTALLKQKADDLLKLIEAQDKFVKNSIHEIYTPLNIIFANIELLQMKSQDSPHLQKIGAAAKIIHNIYNDLNYMIKKDRTEYKTSPLNLSQFVMERVDYFNEVALGNGLQIQTHISPELYVEMNETELQRICDNNLSNAIKYSYENKTVSIYLHRGKNDIILIFENYGKEIENPDKLFDRYYREHESRGGFGLGLSIVKEICDKNSIYVSIESAQGVTRFFYRFKQLMPKGDHENPSA